MSKVFVVKGVEVSDAVFKGLNALNIDRPLKKVVVKPNLQKPLEYPHSIPGEVVDAVVSYFKRFKKGILIVEGSFHYETAHVFKKLGFLEIARKHGVQLIDLNRDFEVEEEKPDAIILKKFSVPRTLHNSYLISIANCCKKESSFKLSLTNVFEGALKWVQLDDKMLDELIVDVNLYLKPNLTIIDARKCLLDSEIKELGVMIFSKDVVAADAVAVRMMGFNPSKCKYLTLAEKAGLGTSNLKKIEVIHL